MDQKPVILIQTRSTSTRLPGKVLAELEPGWTVLDRVVSQCRLTGLQCIVVCPVGDTTVTDWCRDHHYPYHEGSETDVLSRYYNAMKAYGCKWVMRITSDCPFISVSQMHYLAHLAVVNQADWVTNLPTVDGWDIDIVSDKLLSYMNDCVSFDSPDREHVTSFLHKNRQIIPTLGYRCTFYREAVLPSWFPKLSIDTEQDLQYCQQVWGQI